MTQELEFPHPLRLAVGSHQAGSGRGCAMNVVSYENGDTTITDMPSCADPVLAKIVQGVNDSICTHTDDGLLCVKCSMVVLELAHRTVGTGEVVMSDLDRQRVWVRIAADQARQVVGLNDPRVLAAIVAAEVWADEPTEENRVAASAAASAAYTAAYTAASAAASAAYTAASAAASAASASAAASAAYTAAYTAASTAASAAVGSHTRLSLAHRAIDKFEELTGHIARIPEPVVVHAAINAMCG